jgi:dethiobiotin synthetase
MPMAQQGFFITATDTHVGKTVVAAGLAAAIQAQLTKQHSSTQVALWKPVQSGAIEGEPQADSYRLVRGSGLPQSESDTVTYSFAEPLAPSIAASRAGRSIDFNHLLDVHHKLQAGNRFLIVEGAGGLLVPLTDRKLIVDLAYELSYPVIIVARPGLGTVNHTLLTIKQAQASGLSVRGVIINGFHPPDQAFTKQNADMIESYGQVPVLGILPWTPGEPNQHYTDAHEQLEAWHTWRQSWTAIVQAHIHWSLVWNS